MNESNCAISALPFPPARPRAIPRHWASRGIIGENSFRRETVRREDIIDESRLGRRELRKCSLVSEYYSVRQGCPFAESSRPDASHTCADISATHLQARPRLRGGTPIYDTALGAPSRARDQRLPTFCLSSLYSRLTP